MKIIFDPDYKKVEEERLILFAKSARGKVLDIGCAKFPNKFLQNNKNVTEIYGIDLEKINDSNYKETKIVNIDLDGIPYPHNTFDTIIAGEIIEHLTNPYNLLENANRVLKEDGILILSTPNPYYYAEIIRKLMGISVPEDEEHLFLIDKHQLEIIVKKANFEILEIKSYKFWIPKIKIFIISFNLPSLLTYQHIFILKKVKRY